MEKQQKQKASVGWSHDATRALISIWGESNVQEKLDGVKRNKDIYQDISRQLQDMGYSWTWEQCRTKIKNLTQNYRKIKDGNKKTGQGRIVCPFYEEIDAILGNRAASAPPTLLESSGVSDDPGDSLEPGAAASLTAKEGNDSDSDDTLQTSTGKDLDSSKSGLSAQTTEPSSVGGTTVSSTPSATLTKKGAKRKRADMSSELITLLAEMEEKAEERDIKRMKFEAELEDKRNTKEHNHEERMQSMMMGFMTHMMSIISGNRVTSPFPNSHQPSTSYLPSSVPIYQRVPPFDPESQPYSPNPFHDDNI